MLWDPHSHPKQNCCLWTTDEETTVQGIKATAHRKLQRQGSTQICPAYRHNSILSPHVLWNQDADFTLWMVLLPYLFELKEKQWLTNEDDLKNPRTLWDAWEGEKPRISVVLEETLRNTGETRKQWDRCLTFSLNSGIFSALCLF